MDVLAGVRGLAAGQQRIEARLSELCSGQQSAVDALERVRAELAGLERGKATRFTEAGRAAERAPALSRISRANDVGKLRVTGLIEPKVSEVHYCPSQPCRHSALSSVEETTGEPSAEHQRGAVRESAVLGQYSMRSLGSSPGAWADGKEMSAHSSKISQFQCSSQYLSEGIGVNGVLRDSVAASCGLAGGWPRNLQVRRDMQGQKGHIQAILRDSTGHFPSLVHSASVSSVEVSARPSRWMLDPSSMVRALIDVVSLMVLVYDMTLTPLVIAWQLPFEGVVKYGAYVTMAFWTLDIVLTFRTGVYRFGKLEMRPRAIAKRYIRTTFFLDLALVLMDAIGAFLSTYQASVNTAVMLRMIKVSRVLRIVGMLRVAHFIEVVRRLADRQVLVGETGMVVLEVVFLILTILWLNHLVSCVWYWIGSVGDKDTGFSWLDLRIEPAFPQTYKDAGLGYQYFTAFHWSVSQMTPGSMQVSPVNSNERKFNVVCLIFGMLIFSTLVSSLSAKMMHMKMSVQEQDKKLQTLRRFMRASLVSPHLAVSVQKQATERLKNSKKPLTINEVSVVSLLSLSMRRELTWEICRPHLQRHPFFHLFEAVDGYALKKLAAEAVDFLVLSPGDNLFQPGNEATAAYVTMIGTLRYGQDPVTAPVVQENVEEVEPHTWVCEMALWCIWTHVGTMEATTVSELMAVRVEGLVDVIRSRGLIQEVAWEYALCYHARLTSSAPPSASWPNDLHVPYTDFEEIVTSMKGTLQIFIGLAALQAARTSQSGAISGGHLDVRAVEEEVKNRKALLLVNSQGEMIRVAALTVVQLSLADGSKLLAQLGKIENGKLEVGCVLPGMKVDEGEHPNETLNRLLRHRLAPFADAVELETIRSEQVIEYKESSRHGGLKTKYIKNVHSCSLKADYVQPDLVSVQGSPEVFEFVQSKRTEIKNAPGVRRRGLGFGDLLSAATTRTLKAIRHEAPWHRRRSVFMDVSVGFPLDLDVLLVPDLGAGAEGSSVFLNAWITQEEFDLFNTSGGKDWLREYVSLLEIGEDLVMRSARSIGQWHFLHCPDAEDSLALSAPRINPIPSTPKAL